MIAAGGTGGHLYPALATAEALTDRNPELELHFVGVTGGSERQYIEAFPLPRYRYSEILAGPIHGLSLLRKLRSMISLALGFLQSIILLLLDRPRVLLLTGGWTGFPVALAAWLLRIPRVMYLPDIEPGLAIKTLAPFVDRVALHTEESKQYFSAGKCTVVGYPLRKSFLGHGRKDGIQRFQLNENKPTLLVFGGSLGARILNQALLCISSALLEDGWQIIHATGQNNWQDFTRERAGVPQEHYHAFPYLDDIGVAMAAADLILSRAGASVLAESAVYATPSILVPLANPWRYQQVNAQYLADRGVATLIREEELFQSLLPTVRDLSRDDGSKLKQMRGNFGKMKAQNGAELLAKELLKVAE